MSQFIRAVFVLLALTGCAKATPQSLVEMTGFSYYLGCDPATPACWVRFNVGTFYNVLNVGTNTKPIVVRDDLAEMNIITGGFTPQASGVYETRMLMEAISPVAQAITSCGWSTISGGFPPNAVVMIEQQGANLYNNSHMTPFIVNLTGGTTYYMSCWSNAALAFNNLTVQSGPVSPAPIIDFIIRKID